MADDTTDTTAAGADPGANNAPGQNEVQPILSPSDEVGLVLPKKKSSAPAPTQSAAPPSSNLGDDIARILSEVKIPDRRGAQGTSQIPEHRYDTELGAAATDAPSPQEIQTDLTSPVIVPPSAFGAGQQGGTSAEGGVPSSVVALHTMKTDLQDIVREDKMSLVRAAAIAEDRRTEEPVTLHITPRRSGRTGVLIAGVVVFLLLGGAALVGVYVVMHGTDTGGQPASSSILFAEQSAALPIDGQSAASLKQEIASAVATPQVGVGEILQIIPTTATTSASGQTGQAPATLSQFLTALGANPPSDLIGALSDNFFFGIHNASVGSAVFVIPVLSYDRAFAGMLAWEPTIDDDLAPIFTQIPAVTTGANGLPVERQFQDAVMNNYDVRELEDDQGNVVLYYSFPTSNVLIIASSPYTFPEVLSRLQAEGKL